MKKIWKICIFCLICISLLNGCKQETSDEIIKIGTNRALGSITPYVAEQMGYFDERGIQVEVIEFGDGTAIMEAMSAGELDMAICGVVPAAVWQNKGTKIKVVASANAGGHVILSKASSGIRTLEGLKGKKLATPSVGTVTDALLRTYIFGNDPASLSEIDIVPGMKPADMATAMMVSEEVEAIMTWEPFASDALNKYQDIIVLYDCAKEIKQETGSQHFYPVNVILATEAFCSEQPDTLEKTLEALHLTVDYINNDTVAADKLISELLSMDLSIISQARERVEYTFDIDIDATYETLRWAYEQGYLDALPETGLFDMRYVKESN